MQSLTFATTKAISAFQFCQLENWKVTVWSYRILQKKKKQLTRSHVDEIYDYFLVFHAFFFVLYVSLWQFLDIFANLLWYGFVIYFVRINSKPQLCHMQHLYWILNFKMNTAPGTISLLSIQSNVIHNGICNALRIENGLQNDKFHFSSLNQLKMLSIYWKCYLLTWA